MIDTDVLRSGLQSSAGASRTLLRAVDRGSVVPLVSASIVLEYEAVLKRANTLEATGLTAALVDEFLDGLISRAEHVVVPERVRPGIQDPDDEVFVEALLNGRGEAIVTLDVRDRLHSGQRLASRSVTRVPVLRPGEVVRKLA